MQRTAKTKIKRGARAPRLSSSGAAEDLDHGDLNAALDDTS